MPMRRNCRLTVTLAEIAQSDLEPRLVIYQVDEVMLHRAHPDVEAAYLALES